MEIRNPAIAVTRLTLQREQPLIRAQYRPYYLIIKTVGFKIDRFTTKAAFYLPRQILKTGLYYNVKTWFSSNATWRFLLKRRLSVMWTLVLITLVS